MVADSVGRVLPLFGQSFLCDPPSTFSPIDRFQIPSDYVIGPGDELQIRVWGQVEADLRVIVDRSGQIYIPQVGGISVTGVHYGDLEARLKSDISRVFKNFNLTATIGPTACHYSNHHLGNCSLSGTYTVQLFEPLLIASFYVGCRRVREDTFRHIQVRRDGATITDFDFYDLLIKGASRRMFACLRGMCSTFLMLVR